MKLIEITNDALAKEFLDFPARLYKDEPNYIRPLDDDLNKVFDKKKNKFFRHGSLCRWLLQDADGKTIGKVAAFINKRTINKHGQPTGGMGFFDCIKDQDAAFALFDQCKAWLSEQGIEAMDGPINFGERNAFWGLLVEGFDPPIYQMPYNFPYYKDFFEAYGFKDYFQQYSYGLKMDHPRPQKYYDRAEKIMSDPNYTFRHIEKRKLADYGEDFRKVYNASWGKHDGFKQMQPAQAQKVVNSMKPILIEDTMWFGYYKDEPVAMFFMLPELNQYFKHLNGKMNLFAKVKFFLLKTFKPARKLNAILFGVHPDHQKKGMEGAIIIAAHRHIHPQRKYDDLELAWMGDFNPKMMRVCESLGAHVVKTHITYRKLFDENAVFERCPVIQ